MPTNTGLTYDEILELGRGVLGGEPQEPALEPDVQQPEQYELGYWENPQTLAMHYQFLNNGVDYPWGDWLEPDLLNNAYDHLKKFNEAKPSWLDWEALPNSDPYAGILRSMAVPPPEEQYHSIVSRYPEVWDFLTPPEAEQIPELTTTQQQLTTGISPSENVVMTPEMWNELPSFQRVMAGVMSSPILQGAATMLPFSLWALGGALVGGMAGGPAGALVGALAPLAMGAGLGVIGDPQSYEKLKGMGFSDEMVDKTQKIANSSLWLLNQPAEWLEKGIGATIQLAGEEDKDKLDRMLDNLPALFGAGAGTYETFSAQHPTIGNIPAGIEYFIDMVTQGETDIRFAERGEVWKIGEPEPVPVDVYGRAGLEMARNEILKGAAPIEVLQGMQETYGFSGMFTDLAGQIFLDPLNILPLAERKTIGLYAKVADKPMLAKAVQAAKGRGGVETLRIYRSLLRYTGDVDSLSSALKKYAGLTPEGRFKELEPAEGPKGTWEYINTLDPSSQTDALATMGVDMAGLLTNMIDNVDDLDKLVEAWTILKPGEVAEAAKILKTPMAATLSPALKDFKATVYDPMSTLWKGGDLHRVLLHQIADAIDETPKGVLDRMRKMGEAEVIHAQLLEAAAKRGDDAVNALTGDTSFTPAGIKAMLGWFKENPHDFNQFKAQVIAGLGDHVAKWGIEQYGVKPSRASVRFFGGVMKSVQSIILLGLNPMYLVNNLVNNSVTAMHEGVFGYTSPAHIAEFYAEFGVTPRRGEIGYGPAGEVESITGPLREARRAEGLVQEAQDVASGISGKMPFLKGGGAAEVVASRNTTYMGIRKAWNRIWHSDNYAPIPSDVRGEIGDSAAQALITRIDRAKNTGDIDAISKTLGADPGVSAETHIPEIANELGMSSSDVRTIMDDFTDKINRSLDRGATMTDAVALVEADVKKWQVERLKDDLITRAGEVEARVQEEGFAAVLSILADMSIADEDMSMRHWAGWQRHYENVDAAKLMGMSKDAINAMFDGQFSRAQGDYKQHYDFKDTSWQGILKAMGLGDVGDIDNVHPDVRWFYEATKEGNNIWSNYFEQSQARRKEFQDSMMASEWDTKTFGDNYKVLESELAVMYDLVAGKENELNIRKGDLFVKMFGEKFGVDKTAGAAEWWKGISDNAVKRQGFMRDFRAFLRGEPVGSLKSPEVKAMVAGASPQQHRRLWPKFLAEVYLPHIMENNGINADGGWRMFNDIMGRSMEDISGAEKAGYFQSMREAMDQIMPEEVAPPEAVPVEPEVGEAAGILPAPEIEVAPPETAMPEVAPEVAPEAVPAEAPPPRVVTNRTIALEPGTEMRYEFLFKVVELDSLIASHDTNLNINPDFPKELQPRVRDRKASALQIDEISRTLDPDALLIDTHRLDSGSMIVGSDNVVEAGNGRTIALKRARDSYPDMWEGYVQRLREELPNLGLDETALEGMDNPVLVRERVTDVDRKEFTGMIDEQKTLEKSPYERALQDADKINDNVLSRLKVGETQSLDQALNSTPNRDFVRTFMEQFTTNQRGGLMDAAGLLNEAGLVRLKNALFAKTYPGDAGNRLLRTFSESVDPGIKNIEHAMYASLPEIAKLEAAIRSGNLPDNLSITEDVSKAIDVLAHLREDKMLVEDYIGQTDMFGKELDDFQTNLLEYFGTYSRSQAVMRHTLQEYARAALQQPAKAQALMFDTTRLAKGDIFHATIKDLRPESLPLFEDLPRQAAPGVGQELEGPIARGPEGVEGAEGVAGVGAAAGEVQPVVEAPPPIAAAGPRALGTLDSLGGPRYESQIYNEGHAWYVRPVLDELVRQSILKGDTPGKADLSKLSPEAMTSMKKWLGEVKQDMTKTKMGAVQLGYHARDMSILNYNSRYGLDNVLGVGFPYHFWFTHSMMNWAIRALDRPAFLAWMGKLAKFSDKSKDERSNLPSRLQGRWGIPQAFLPDWAGGNTWVDPLGKFFPILEFMRPIERIAQSESRFTRQAEFAIMGWARDGQIEQADAELAMTSRDGPIWERAFTQAKLEEGGRDPFDYMSMFISPALWLTIPAKIMQGKGEEISPMPPSRTIQALATATGVDALRFLDVEAHIRKSMGINAFGEWGDYYVDRQLANIAAERPEVTQEALLAMIDRSGPVFEEALQRVQFEMMLRNPGAAPIYTARTGQGVGDVLGSMVFGWLPAHLLPQSELKQRGLKTQYDAAWEEYNKGNKQAITTFFDENPEYKARLALWDEPEERMRQFLISNVWDQWHSMPKGGIEREAVKEQLGSVFQDQFLNLETQDYDSLDIGTLAQWAKQMGGVVPEGIDIAQGELELPPKADAVMYQDYLAARDRAYPGIMNVQYSYFSAAPQTQDMIRQNTPLTDYWAWNDKYIATHPGLMQYVIKEDSDLFGVDFNTANLVYQFKTARHEQWPDYYDMQDEYYDENTGQARKREIMQRLGKAYDWERETITQFPQILPYVRSAESIAKGYLKNDYKSKIDWQAQFDMSKIEPAAVRQLNNYYRSDETLTSGAMIYLRQVWESEGKPSDSLMDWIESMRVQFVGSGI